MSYERVNRGYKQEVAYLYDWCVEVLQVDKDEVIRNAALQLAHLLSYKTFPHEKGFLKDDLFHKKPGTERNPFGFLLQNEMTFNLLLFLVYFYELPTSHSSQSHGPTPTFDNLLKTLPFFTFVLKESVGKGGVTEEMMVANQGKFLLGEIHPNLEYDPEYRKILQSSQYQETFINYRDKKHDEIDAALHAGMQKAQKSDLAPSAGTVLLKRVLNPPHVFLDLLDSYERYYCLRVPSRSNEIKRQMSFFKIVFELDNARMDATIPFRKFQARLAQTFSRDETQYFLQNYILDVHRMPFATSKADFKPTRFFTHFNESLKVIGYLHAGVVRTGFCMIWRALLKYWEDLADTREFINTRGKLLENYCYEIISDLGIECQKIILKDPNKPETPQYKDMLQQISDFPKPPIRLEFDSFQKASFQEKSFTEIDLACRGLIAHRMQGHQDEGQRGPLYF